MGEVQLKISGFKNPVNERKKYGFSLTTQDINRNDINVSEEGLPLDVSLTQINQESNRQMAILGDGTGDKVGRVGTY